MNVNDPRESFPSGSYVPIEFPLPNGRALTIKVDGACLARAQAIIGRHKAGEISEGEATQALHDLEFGLPDD